jgi:hypothetical protein
VTKRKYLATQCPIDNSLKRPNKTKKTFSSNLLSSIIIIQKVTTQN